MFIIIEKEELSQMYQQLVNEEHSDIPEECQPTTVIFDELSEMLDQLIMNDIAAQEEAPLHYDQTFIDLAKKVYDYIFNYIVHSAADISWVRMIDRRGGLVIHVRTRSTT